MSPPGQEDDDVDKEYAPLMLLHDSEASAAASQQAVLGSSGSTMWRLRKMIQVYPHLLGFALGLFGALAFTLVLIDTWGPDVFRRLIFPGSASLPYETLFVFSLGDLGGILISIAVVDRIGRRGCFYVGFFGQAMVFAALALASKALARLAPNTQGLAVPGLTLLGALGYATRCFGCEAAHLWTLEVFPTALRGTAFAAATSMMRLLSIVSLSLSGGLMDGADPHATIFIFAALLCFGGVLAVFLPRETANMPVEDAPRAAGMGTGGTYSGEIKKEYGSFFR